MLCFKLLCSPPPALSLVSVMLLAASTAAQPVGYLAAPAAQRCGDGECHARQGEDANSCPQDCARPETRAQDESARPPQPSQRGWTLAADAGAMMFFRTGSIPMLTVDGRAGYRFDLGRFFVDPEILGGYVGVPTADGFTIGRAGAGARIGTTWLRGELETSAFSHLGGWFHATGGGPAADVGLAFDVRVGRWLSVGGQTAFDLVLSGFGNGNGIQATPLVLLGAHAGAVL